MSPGASTAHRAGEANGAAAAAVLGAGIGCAVLGALALAADANESLARALTFYLPTGDLSGVTTLAILVWLAAWRLLAWRWAGREIGSRKVALGAFGLLLVGLALTFPPIMDFLQGR
jgi:asparagine N-glycosylation enzyme membrane subunit Stt3